MTIVLTDMDGVALVEQCPGAACPCRDGQPEAPWCTCCLLLPLVPLTVQHHHCLVCCRLNSTQLHFRYLHVTHVIKHLSVEFNSIFAVWKQEG